MRNTIRSLRRKLNEARGRDLALATDARVPSAFLGTDYGGWTVATRPLPASPVIFSVGLGCDISFDLAAIAEFGARVYGFDPTPKSRTFIEGQTLPTGFTYVPTGLASYDGTMTLRLPRQDWDSYTSDTLAGDAADVVHCPVARLATLASTLGIRAIDVLKMDIEGGEYDAIPDILRSGLPVGQLLVELHYDASEGQMARARELVTLIRAAGYRLFARSPVGRELSFIHESRL